MEWFEERKNLSQLNIENSLFPAQNSKTSNPQKNFSLVIAAGSLSIAHNRPSADQEKFKNSFIPV